jgi:diacylglycerol kinase family enzyme
MYGYIYDVFLSQAPYEKELIRIENSLTDLGLNGHTIKLSLINNIGHAIEDLQKRGVTTIVAVGSDQLFSKLADRVAEDSTVTLGLIPLGSHQQLAELFGIPEGESACRVLSARLVQPVPLSRINNAYFIHSCYIYDPKIRVSFDEEFTVSPTSTEAQITIFNPKKDESDMRETSLTAVIAPAAEKKMFRKSEPLPPTSIKSPRILLTEPRGVPIIVDGQKIINTPAVLEVSQEVIKVIMGKERKI